MQTSTLAVVSVPAMMTLRVSEKSRGKVFSSGGRDDDMIVCIISTGSPSAGSGLFIDFLTQPAIVLVAEMSVTDTPIDQPGDETHFHHPHDSAKCGIHFPGKSLWQLVHGW
jgi:hypothetical protein